MTILETRGARLEIDAARGGRLASLRIDGLEIFVTDAPDPLHWGCYPMAPWASRVRNGRFEFRGRSVELPLRMPPHAIHGTLLDRAWRVEEASASTCVLETELGEAWPWAGRARQCLALTESGLECRLEVHSRREAFPASLGWHPWFLRDLERGDPVAIDFEARSVYLTDAAGLPTGKKASPGAGPFDDCFTELVRNPVLRWPGALELTLSSNLDHWVVYDQPEHAVCVEPISAPPDVFNLATRAQSDVELDIVEPDRPLVGRFELAWRVA